MCDREKKYLSLCVQRITDRPGRCCETVGSSFHNSFEKEDSHSPLTSTFFVSAPRVRSSYYDVRIIRKQQDRFSPVFIPNGFFEYLAAFGAVILNRVPETNSQREFLSNGPQFVSLNHTPHRRRRKFRKAIIPKTNGQSPDDIADWKSWAPKRTLNRITNSNVNRNIPRRS